VSSERRKDGKSGGKAKKSAEINQEELGLNSGNSKLGRANRKRGRFSAAC
jgi:hypothetical protein